MIQKSEEMDKLKVGDVLIMDGKSYVSMDMYKNLQNQLHTIQETAEGFLQKLVSIEIANENRKSMRVISNNLKLTGGVCRKSGIPAIKK